MTRHIIVKILIMKYKFLKSWKFEREMTSYLQGKNNLNERGLIIQNHEGQKFYFYFFFFFSGVKKSYQPRILYIVKHLSKWKGKQDILRWRETKRICHQQTWSKILASERDLQEGGGVRHGDHLLLHRYIRNTSTCGKTPTEHLLNTSRTPQTS